MKLADAPPPVASAGSNLTRLPVSIMLGPAELALTSWINSWRAAQYYLSTVLDDYSRHILAQEADPDDGRHGCTGNAGEGPGQGQARPGAGAASPPAALGQRAVLCVRGAAALPGGPAHGAHPRGAVPPDDPGQDRALPSLDDYSPCARSGKNLIQLQNYAFPWDLEREIGRFVDYYNHQPYHESLDNVTPADVYFGRVKEVLSRREEIKRKTLEARRRQHTQSLMMAA